MIIELYCKWFSMVCLVWTGRAILLCIGYSSYIFNELFLPLVWLSLGGATALWNFVEKLKWLNSGYIPRRCSEINAFWCRGFEDIYNETGPQKFYYANLYTQIQINPYDGLDQRSFIFAPTDLNIGLRLYSLCSIVSMSTIIVRISGVFLRYFLCQLLN